MNNNALFTSGVTAYQQRLESQKALYTKLIDLAKADTTASTVFRLSDKELFYEVMRTFDTALCNENAKGDLFDIYAVAIHKATNALIIANKGATLFGLTEKTQTPHIVRHIGFIVYTPGLGIEYGNVGLVGNVYDGKVVLRTESACTPSFLYGSQRCNCHHQWQNVRELAAYFNKIKTPKIKDGEQFEHWVQTQFEAKGNKHICSCPGKVGFVLLHVDSQNGMGSGYTPNEFVPSLTERASLRHRGEYTSEQLYDTTMYGGFTSIGISGDPRSENNQVGYKLTPVILDYLETSKHIIMLSNNPYKLNAMTDFGYNITRVKSIGAVNPAGSTEALQRGTEFNHLDIDNKLVSFQHELKRMKKELSLIVRG